MATIVTRAGKGSALTWVEADANFTNLNTDKPDYETGTWSPVISDGTNNATMNGAAGRYVKIGRLVVLSGIVQTSSLGSVTGAIRITGLPFTCSVGAQYEAGSAPGLVSGLAITAGNSVGFYLRQGTAYIEPFVLSATTGSVAMTATQWSADGQARFSLSYFTD